MSGQTMALAGFVAGLQYEKLPPAVRNMVKRCLFDTLGCSIFATQTDMGRLIIQLCTEGNFGSSNIFPEFAGEYEASFAAFSNGTCAHGFELDDVHLPSVSHPGAAVIPAAIALAQERGADGKTLMEAIVAGYEVMARIGSTIGSAHVDHGFHPTSSYGTFGAAAACAKILGLDAQHTAWALGLAGSLASGLFQFSISGSMVKRIHAGKAAQQGVLVAKLAGSGFTGPTDILEGQYGFCRVYRGTLAEEDIKWGELTDGLGERNAIMETAVKPSAACGCLHAVIEAVQDLKETPAFDASKIEKIVVRGHRNLVEEHNIYEPVSILSAQYSLPFCVGMTLVRDIEDASLYLNEAILRDPQILAYASLVSAELDEEIDALFPARFGAKVDIELEDGTVLSKTVYAQKGSAENPFTDEEIRRKFQKLAGSVISGVAIATIGERIETLETLASTKELFAGL